MPYGMNRYLIAQRSMDDQASLSSLNVEKDGSESLAIASKLQRCCLRLIVQNSLVG